jgi:hypothetical protein
VGAARGIFAFATFGTFGIFGAFGVLETGGDGDEEEVSWVNVRGAGDETESVE